MVFVFWGRFVPKSMFVLMFLVVFFRFVTVWKWNVVFWMMVVVFYLSVEIVVEKRFVGLMINLIFVVFLVVIL